MASSTPTQADASTISGAAGALRRSEPAVDGAVAAWPACGGLGVGCRSWNGMKIADAALHSARESNGHLGVLIALMPWGVH
mmetsp:Transcript_14631/g.41924  ORF Transcript_14631/g.41924 Transcript_14631/m.41924 type:complete len:81 (-) Transcript_14631:89-331(-)